jgi:cell shape-determining protein MreC
MSRINRQLVSSKRLLPVAVAVVVLLAVVPARWTAWEAWFGATLQQLVAPVSQPVSAVARWIVPARSVYGDESAEAQRLRQEAAQWAQMYRVKQAEVEELSRTIRELQKNLEFRRNDPVALVQASVIGSGVDPSTGLILVRAGIKQGVGKDAVAVVDGVQLVGQVVRAEQRVCFVRPITSVPDPRKPPWIEAMIFLDESSAGVAARLTPRADGLLQGQFVSTTLDQDTKVQLQVPQGAIVRLVDSSWPPAAQMLVIGRVERIETVVKDPLRKVVIVRPTVEPLDHVGEVTLHVPLDSEDRSTPPPVPSTKGTRR